MVAPKNEDASSDDDQSFHSLDDDSDTEPDPPSTSPAPKSPLKPSFSKTSSTNPPSVQGQPERFPPEEEQKLLSDSNAQKTTANALFGQGSYENALQQYDQALALCPNYLDYEIAVLRSNAAACHLKLGDWKAASEAASSAIECLERLEPLPRPEKEGKSGDTAPPTGDVQEVDAGVEARMEQLLLSGHTLAEVRKLQVKLLMRRAKAKTEQSGWANLQAADEDYRVLLAPGMAGSLSPTDKRSVTSNARALTPKLNRAKEQEMAEMMGKLKGLGNSMLKPFGLSTDNFQFVKDEKTGGYSMNFDQKAGGKK